MIVQSAADEGYRGSRMQFLLIVLFYGGMQFFFAYKTGQAFALAGPGWVALLAWASFMTAGPFLLWRLEHCQNCHDLSVAGAWVVYAWMGFSFLFFWFGLVWSVAGWGAAQIGRAHV